MCPIENLTVRPSDLKEAKLFSHLLQQPDVLEYFPMYDIREIEDSVKVWEIFCKRGASLTAYLGKEPCGLAFLNLQAYKKFAHQCLITIIVAQEFRGRGIGTALLNELFVLGKEKFALEFVHLEVYETNPAISLYRRMGFETYGVHKRFLKDQKRYSDKILMEKNL